ncbi:type II toxin-antitoxin system VapC family toxin [Parerythrobacter lacustris]|uniref:Type II toxin-antitoxin system VapC family toxin n=1 Tax=Parerythrobacter lacustris TaxID=2969984 RepID=A0ABT1XT43_9SPHN|nr:type II toxin-antitoxin system VapC family toxin [Parerythrobacter lacustris]MCR2834838.1 type II toxin-antitoxin system VapC family toxin [Parerythrobacter lacustris]
MIVDSNVLIDILNPDCPDADRVVEVFSRLSRSHVLRINLVVFAETCSRFTKRETAERAVEQLDLEIAGLSLDDAFRAGLAFREYRRKGGPRQSILPDFLIGGQAANRGWPILTRDSKRFASYFPEIEVIDPLQAKND